MQNEDEFLRYWQQNYNGLKKYLYENQLSISIIPKKFRKWVRQTRSLYREGKLSREQINSMDSLHGWDWEYLIEWDLMYHKYAEFVRDKGFHPCGSQDNNPENILKKWASKNRKDYMDNILTHRQGKLLEKIQGWRWVQRNVWMAKYNQLEKFIRIYGRYPVNIQWLSPNFEISLSKWVQKQKDIKDYLSDFEKSQLESLANWKWNPPKVEFKFINPTMYDRLKKYSANYGDITIASSMYGNANTVDPELSTWVQSMTNNYRNKSLTCSDVCILRVWISEIDFEETWRENYALYQNFVHTHGRIPNTFGTEKNEKYLLSWLDEVERYYRSGKLTEDKLEFAENLF